MNILFLDSWLSDRATGSGSAVAIAGLARGLVSLGHTVDVIRPRRRLASLGLTRLIYNLSLPRRFAAVADRYDLAVGFDVDGWRLPANRPIRYVVALKGVAAEERRFESGWQGLRFDLLRRLEGNNARSAHKVFVTSRYAAAAAIDAYGLNPERVRIVPEALDAEVHRRATAAAGRDMPPHLREPIILSVARQYRRKDTPTLLRAFANLLERVSAARLRIVGDGPELPAARRLAARLGLGARVRFMGSVASAAALDAEYRNARVFCLPSRQEGFGIVFLEAMAYGLPIAAANAGAVPEVAPEAETSLLVPPGDAEALAGALERLLTDTDLAVRLGATGVARCRQFRWPSAARQFLDLLDD